MAESISEGTLKQWLKKVGDYVEVDEEVATIETDKVRWLFSLLLLIKLRANDRDRLMYLSMLQQQGQSPSCSRKRKIL